MKTKKITQNIKPSEEDLEKNPEEMDKKPGLIASSFSKTIGIVVAIVVVIVCLALIIYLGVLGRDKYVGSQYEKQPSYSKDNQWGGLAVNVVIDKKEIREPGQPTTTKVDCGSVLEQQIRAMAIEEGRAANLPACGSNITIPGRAGSVVLTGEINVKNILWLESKIIPTNLLTFNHDGRQVKPKLSKNIFGQYLNHSQGTSTKFTYEEPYSAKDFQLYLNDATKSALIVGDNIEPEHK